MTQTAVQWLCKWFVDNYEATIEETNQAFDQALQMEKDQIIAAVNSQRQLGWDEKGEEYYEQNYGGEQ
jgi:hypothetical protein